MLQSLLTEQFMAITKQDVEHVARLSRLSLSEAEKEKFTAQLGNILDHIQELSKVNTAGVEPTAHPFALQTAWRQDVKCVWGSNEPILQNAPDREESFFKVKKVIE